MCVVPYHAERPAETDSTPSVDWLLGAPVVTQNDPSSFQLWCGATNSWFQAVSCQSVPARIKLPMPRASIQARREASPRLPQPSKSARDYAPAVKALQISNKSPAPTLHIGFSIPGTAVILGVGLWFDADALLPRKLPLDPRPRFIILPRTVTNSQASPNMSSSIPSVAS